MTAFFNDRCIRAFRNRSTLLNGNGLSVRSTRFCPTAINDRSHLPGNPVWMVSRTDPQGRLRPFDFASFLFGLYVERSGFDLCFDFAVEEVGRNSRSR